MFAHQSTANDSLIYPGTYAAKTGKQDITEPNDFSFHGSFTFSEPLVDELKDTFKFRIKVNTASRENICVKVSLNVVHVSVDSTKSISGNNPIAANTPIDFPAERIYLILPEYADTEFMGAEFNEGVLTLYIPKNETPVRNNSKEVIVY